jgi:hypothetical protein
VLLYGPFDAHGAGGRFDYKVKPSFTFKLRKNERELTSSEFGNYLTGFTCYSNFGIFGHMGARGGGEIYGFIDDFYGQSTMRKMRNLWYNRGTFDDLGSKYWILRGSLDAHIEGNLWYDVLPGSDIVLGKKFIELYLRYNVTILGYLGDIDTTIQ